MIGRLAALALLAWALGFAAFTLLLPGPAGAVRTDALVVPTGAPGRIPRGLALLDAGAARRMLVTGVGAGVRRADLAREYGHRRTIACCVDLGAEAFDTRSNARETAAWMRANRFRSLRLVTSDWHARRAEMELRRELDAGTQVAIDGVPGEARLGQLLNEYHKLVLRRLQIGLAPWLPAALGGGGGGGRGGGAGGGAVDLAGRRI